MNIVVLASQDLPQRDIDITKELLDQRIIESATVVCPGDDAELPSIEGLAVTSSTDFQSADVVILPRSPIRSPEVVSNALDQGAVLVCDFPPHPGNSWFDPVKDRLLDDDVSVVFRTATRFDPTIARVKSAIESSDLGSITFIQRNHTSHRIPRSLREQCLTIGLPDLLTFIYLLNDIDGDGRTELTMVSSGPDGGGTIGARIGSVDVLITTTWQAPAVGDQHALIVAGTTATALVTTDGSVEIHDDTSIQEVDLESEPTAYELYKEYMIDILHSIETGTPLPADADLIKELLRSIERIPYDRLEGETKSVYRPESAYAE